MAVFSFVLNGENTSVDCDPAMPMLHVLREELDMTGTKFGCGAGLCGACTIHLDGAAIRSCQLPVEAVDGQTIRTIEGLGSKDALHAVQQAWIAEQVPQCGYCQSGMIMAAASLLEEVPEPTSEDVDAAMTNLCRCGTYQRVKKAIFTAAETLREPVSADG
ncbi:MAG: (2Fe-2S)-binding protein [Sphingomonadales bacterium]